MQFKDNHYYNFNNNLYVFIHGPIRVMNDYNNQNAVISDFFYSVKDTNVIPVDSMVLSKALFIANLRETELDSITEAGSAPSIDYKYLYETVRKRIVEQISYQRFKAKDAYSSQLIKGYEDVMSIINDEEARAKRGRE